MKKIEYEFTRKRLMSGFDGITCKACPSIDTDGEVTLLSYIMLYLKGTDIFNEFYLAKSTDGGKTFSEPIRQTHLPETHEDNLIMRYSAVPYYNKTHKKWFGLGLKTPYEDETHTVIIDGVTPAKAFYCDIDTKTCQFVNPKNIDIPFEHVCGYNFGQFVELEDGDMLVPFSFTTKDNTRLMIVTLRYRFTDSGIEVAEVGTPIVANDHGRGLAEPSLAKLKNKYYMTIRSDEVGLYAVSDDGYTFSEPKPYVWDDGTVLENYNTQQHWMINKDGLFLAYTRKGAHNDHVFRHRAPIFMTRFDEERECLIRDEEVILVPELGARLGNFCALAPNDNEAWLITAEWMQSWGEELGICEKYGSDNSLWFTKVFWKN